MIRLPNETGKRCSFRSLFHRERTGDKLFGSAEQLIAPRSVSQ
jgi:hypothetical protein